MESETFVSKNICYNFVFGTARNSILLRFWLISKGFVSNEIIDINLNFQKYWGIIILL